MRKKKDEDENSEKSTSNAEEKPGNPGHAVMSIRNLPDQTPIPKLEGKRTEIKQQVEQESVYVKPNPALRMTPLPTIRTGNDMPRVEHVESQRSPSKPSQNTGECKASTPILRNTNDIKGRGKRSNQDSENDGEEHPTSPPKRQVYGVLRVSTTIC